MQERRIDWESPIPSSGVDESIRLVDNVKRRYLSWPANDSLLGNYAAQQDIVGAFVQCHVVVRLSDIYNVFSRDTHYKFPGPAQSYQSTVVQVEITDQRTFVALLLAWNTYL